MKGEDIAYRLRRYAADVVRLSRRFPPDFASKHIARQLLRSGTGGGSNYEEARGSESRADFVHKLGIANKELRESLYWLELAQDADVIGNVGPIAREASELIAILTRSIRTAKGDSRER